MNGRGLQASRYLQLPYQNWWQQRYQSSRLEQSTWLVTTDEIPDPAKLTYESRLNGQVVQKTPVSDLVFDVPALVA